VLFGITARARQHTVDEIVAGMVTVTLASQGKHVTLTVIASPTLVTVAVEAVVPHGPTARDHQPASRLP
jgi:branched-subunit amino acid transport protein AzlD